MRPEPVIGADCLLNLLRTLRLGSDVDVLSPIAVGPAVEGILSDRCQIVGHEVGSDLVALVDDGPQLAAVGLEGHSCRIAGARRIRSLHASESIDLPDHRAALLRTDAVLDNVAVRADANVELHTIRACGQSLRP